jgi:hypothetical protein
LRVELEWKREGGREGGRPSFGAPVEGVVTAADNGRRYVFRKEER